MLIKIAVVLLCISIVVGIIKKTAKLLIFAGIVLACTYAASRMGFLPF